ncbi:hypothetical protein [Massilia varians]|uniref:hypothetical protein n=1 Tax=Massilia varians TaxID=457921 RepID=UPI002492FE56|nr:hypothetical protein [Massilia varians]
MTTVLVEVAVAWAAIALPAAAVIASARAARDRLVRRACLDMLVFLQIVMERMLRARLLSTNRTISVTEETINVAIRYRFAMLQENNTDLLRKIMTKVFRNAKDCCQFHQ